jgi:hypothetical protein
VRDRDCDVVLDVPTVSGRHARLWVQRRANTNTSQLFVTDVGSTNGTWVNRYRIRAWRDVPLFPGDLVHFAQPDAGFIVRLDPASGAATLDPLGAGAAAAAQGTPGEGREALPEAVGAALEVAAALEAAAAAGGVFPAPAADGAAALQGVADRARELITAGEYIPARMLLLGEAMRHPMDGGACSRMARPWALSGVFSGGKQ